MLQVAWNTFIELAPWLLLGAAVAGLLEVWLPPGWLRRQLTGRWGVARAVVLGVPLPLCSCGVIPTGLGLKKQGASDGATVGFLISTPQTGVDSVLVTAALLGWPFALFKLLIAAVTGLVGGWIADAAARCDRAINPLPILDDAPPAARWQTGWATADELLRSIWRWIVIGVIISAGITTLLPTGRMENLTAYQGIPGMLVALVISLPLYVCATASVPIAASLVAAGLPPGAAMVFLMAGPATNVATIGAVYRTLGTRQLVVYLVTIILGSIVGGLLFGWLIDSTPIVAPHQHDQQPWWALVSAGLLALLFLRYAGEALQRRITNKRAKSCCEMDP